jgi:DNA (cytosine-5)-methyltransferase 1
VYKVLDLFCGCGGMSWGLHKRGFNIIAGIDMSDIALKTFQYNHRGARVYNLDISSINPVDIMSDLNLNYGELDIMIGGPPCQGFSKNTPASWRFLEDPQNQLYHSYLDFVKCFNPKIAIIENVAEIYNAYNKTVRNEIMCKFHSLGYDISVSVINMSDYGVPQKRRRCVFFASRIGEPSFPITDNNYVTAWEAISDLPIVEQGEGFDGMQYTMPAINHYQRHMRSNSITLFNHIGRKMQPLQARRIASIGPGQGLKDMPDELKVKGGYSGAYGRLDYEMLSPTITRWVFHTGSGRFAHPREVRGLTMREAARLQSFSDDFVFHGSFSEQAGQIGNAVPPLFMEKFADNIISAIKNSQQEYRQMSLLPFAVVQA